MISSFFFNKGNDRTSLVKKNVFFSFILQGISILCSFLLVPLTLGYLNADEYGVWLTLNSIITWFNVCDIGIGMGLKNKLAEAIAIEDYNKGKKYVSVTYIMLTLIILLFLIIFLIIGNYIDWCKILNIHTISPSNLYKVVFIVVSFFCINFIVKTIGIILTADQRISYNSLMSVLSSLISLLFIWILTKTTEPSLFNVALVFSIAPVAVFIIGSIICFTGKYKRISPSFKLFDIVTAKELFTLSISFFILQVSSIIVFTTSNIIITQTIGPDEVTVYNICFKYFNIITLGFNILLSPMWPAYTNAYALGDMVWIKKGIQKSIFLWLLLNLLALIMLAFSPFMYRMWIGDIVKIPFYLSLTMFIYVAIGNWNNIFAQMLAGVGKIRLSIINSIFNAILYIPLAIFFGERIGSVGVTVAMSIILLTSSFWQPIQCYKIINMKAKGIWNK